MKYNVLIFFLFATIGFSQVQIDTSYTPLSTYNKEKKKFPIIKLVQKADNKDVIKLNNIAYKSIDSRELHFDAYYTNQKSPAVILIHGGGWKSGNKSQMHFLAQEIAANGYACFTVEYRLSPEAKFPAAVLDIKSAIQFIRTNANQFNVDTNKIAVLGCSSGGQLAALIGTTNGNPEFEDSNSLKQTSNVQAIINMDGILAFHHPESNESNAASLWLNGSFDENPKNWTQASALTHTNQNTPPILFINSDQPRFHAGRNDMIAILDKYKIYNSTKTISNSPHSFWFFDPWFDEIVGYSIQFLDKIFKQK